MEPTSFNQLLLKTAFSCMACDGDIDKRELKLLKELHQKKLIFGEVDINEELDKLLHAINENGHKFLKDYLSEISSSNLSETEELNLVEVAIDTIKSDEELHYSEIKFFKVIRSKLKVENQFILEKHPDFEDYLEEDIISDSYLLRIQEDFFDAQTLPVFKPLREIDEDLLGSL
jgi:uncharacterized tellurite resistance protein B-like protein